MEFLAGIARGKACIYNPLVYKTAQKENWIVQGVMAD